MSVEIVVNPVASRIFMPSYSRSPINVLIQHPVARSHSLMVRSRPPLNKI
ncbi:hypothetical protein QUA54_03300 [Microcoleus sp. MOSTC5]